MVHSFHSLVQLKRYVYNESIIKITMGTVKYIFREAQVKTTAKEHAKRSLQL